MPFTVLLLSTLAHVFCCFKEDENGDKLEYLKKKCWHDMIDCILIIQNTYMYVIVCKLWVRLLFLFGKCMAILQETWGFIKVVHIYGPKLTRHVQTSISFTKHPNSVITLILILIELSSDKQYIF